MRYRREDGCRAWLTYGMLEPEMVQDLIQSYGSAETVYDRFRETQGGCLKNQISEQSLNFLRQQAEPTAMHEMMLTMQRLEIGIMSIEDDLYPEALRQIQSPPTFLFYRGDPSVLLERSLTIVGTRRATAQGMQAAFDIARDLSASGVVIVSGLASGIDTAGHEGCLAGGSPTVGVCAGGIDLDYPATNHELREKIVSSGGLLLSEFPLGSPALAWHFDVRNRILAGLSRGVLMIEARIKSGTMLTVRHALDQGREVFAWPGVLGSECAEAAHVLLREGARFFTNAADVLEDFGWDRVKQTTKEEKATLPPLNDDQKRIVKALGMGEQSMDQLAQATGLETASLSTALTMLQIMGIIQSLPGKVYKII